MGQLYEMTFTATGEVRDKDGNLVETVPVHTTRVVTAEEAAEILGHTEGEPE